VEADDCYGEEIVPVKKRFILVLLAVATALSVAGVAFALGFGAPLTITENSTTDYTMVGLGVPSNNDWMADNGFFADAEGLDTRVETLGGLAKPHMVADNATWFAIPVPADSQTNLYYTTGDTPLPDFRMIFGVGSYFTVSDDPALELGDNFSVKASGWIDTTESSCSTWALDFDGTAYGESADKSTFAWMHGKGDVASFEFTIELWMRTDTPEPDAIYPLVTTCDLTSLDTGVYFAMDDRSGAGHSRALVLHIYQSDAGKPVFDTYLENAYPNDTDWHYIAVTYDQSLANTNGVFYVDGIAVGTGDKTANAPDNADSSHELHLGSDGPEAFFFTGDLDEVRISDAVRTPEEIESDWLEVCLDVDASTFALWHLDEGTGATANDSSATSADLTLTNTEWTDGCGGSARCLVRKPNAFCCYVPGVGSNITALVPGGASVSTSGVSSGEHTVEVSANVTCLGLYLDGTLEDSALLGANVTDNANDWVFLADDVMPYCDNITISVNGTEVARYEPTTMIEGTTLPDETGTYDGTISWGINPASIGVTLGSMVADTQPSIGGVADEVTTDILPDDVGQVDWSADPDVSGTLATNPLRPFVTIMSDTTSLDEAQAWMWLAIAFVLASTLATAKLSHGHKGVTGIVMGVSIGVCVTLTIFPLWMLIIAVVVAIFGVISERSPTL